MNKAPPLSKFQHNEGCTKYEFHLQRRDGEYRAQCAGCGATTSLTAQQAEEWSQYKTIPSRVTQHNPVMPT